MEQENEKKAILLANRTAKGGDSLKHEYNKQLLLELIVKRIQADPKVYFSKNHLHSSIKLIIQDTMSRFKTMKAMYGASNLMDNYEKLYELVSGKKMEGIDIPVHEEFNPLVEMVNIRIKPINLIIKDTKLS